MFGYEPRALADGRTALCATREKALLDLLYLYPFYNTEEELENLRLDRVALHEDLDRDRLHAFAACFRCHALEGRVRLLREVYAL
mgnify:FL=1